VKTGIAGAAGFEGLIVSAADQMDGEVMACGHLNGEGASPPKSTTLPWGDPRRPPGSGRQSHRNPVAGEFEAIGQEMFADCRTYAVVDDLKRDAGFWPATSIEEGLARFVHGFGGKRLSGSGSWHNPPPDFQESF